MTIPPNMRKTTTLVKATISLDIISTKIYSNLGMQFI